jgi:hypothetical protein
MKKIIPLCLVLTGCTFYNVNEVGVDTYRISGSASALKSRSAIIQNVKDKAASVCGNDNYEYIDESTGKVNPNYSGNVASTSQTITMTVRCKEI